MMKIKIKLKAPSKSLKKKGKKKGKKKELTYTSEIIEVNNANVKTEPDDEDASQSKTDCSWASSVKTEPDDEGNAVQSKSDPCQPNGLPPIQDNSKKTNISKTTRGFEVKQPKSKSVQFNNGLAQGTYTDKSGIEHSQNKQSYMTMRQLLRQSILAKRQNSNTAKHLHVSNASTKQPFSIIIKQEPDSSTASKPPVPIVIQPIENERQAMGAKKRKSSLKQQVPPLKRDRLSSFAVLREILAKPHMPAVSGVQSEPNNGYEHSSPSITKSKTDESSRKSHMNSDASVESEVNPMLKSTEALPDLEQLVEATNSPKSQVKSNAILARSQNVNSSLAEKLAKKLIPPNKSYKNMRPINISKEVLVHVDNKDMNGNIIKSSMIASSPTKLVPKQQPQCLKKKKISLLKKSKKNEINQLQARKPGVTSNTSPVGTKRKQGVPCPDCDHVAPNKGDLRKHMRKHSPDKPYSCPIEGCNFRTKHPGKAN